MAQSHSLLRFDLPRQLLAWVNVSTCCKRKGRRFLESHLSLLSSDAITALEHLLLLARKTSSSQIEELSVHLQLIRDIQTRGGTQRAVRDAYLNLYGTSTMELPPWLSDLEDDRLLIQRIKRPERTNRSLLALLRRIVQRLLDEEETQPELLADYQNALGVTLLESSHFQSQRDLQQALEEAIDQHRHALKIFTRKTYPLQYALTQLYLGVAYQRSSLFGHQHMLELAIDCYETALPLLILPEHREQRIFLHLYLGNAYTQYAIWHGLLYLERAHEYLYTILPELQGEEMAFFQALAHVHLGDAYRAACNTDGIRNALVCYRTAARYYCTQPLAAEGAGTHLKIASIYQHLARIHPEQEQHYLRCAIICCEKVLDVYSYDSYPVEYGQTKVQLGHLHSQLANLNTDASFEEALRYYREALHVFTRQAFPHECEQIMHCLTQVEMQRRARVSLVHSHSSSL